MAAISELIRRVAMHPVASEKWVLRGGYVMRLWCKELGIDRPASDIDFVLADTSMTVEEARDLLRVIVADNEDLSTGGPTDTPSLSLHSEQLTWEETSTPGYKFSIRGDEESEFQVDISSPDPVVVPPVRTEVLPGCVLLVPTKETACAWKLNSLLERELWHCKHLVDSYLLLTRWHLDETVLVPAIDLAFVSRGEDKGKLERLVIGNMGISRESRRRWERFRTAAPPSLAAAIPTDPRDAAIAVGESVKHLVLDADSVAVIPPISVISFGYKNGRYAVDDDTMIIWINVRHWQPPPKNIRDECDGRSTRLATALFKNPGCEDLYQGVWVRVLYAAQHRSATRLTVAVGCEEGRHRSVAIVERLAKDLQKVGLACVLLHRDVDNTSAVVKKTAKERRHDRDKRVALPTHDDE